MSDSLASKLIEPTKKKSKPTSTVMTKNDTLDDKQQIVSEELFPGFEDDGLVKVLTQIEKENELLKIPEEQKNNNQSIPKQNSPKTLNFSSVTNISNVNHTPLLPTMYFPHSNVTINYNFPK